MNQLLGEIERLKQEKDAVILAHYYVEDRVKTAADYVGDSYYLARLATELPQRTIVLCGVTFMGESVKLLNPDKTVLMPDLSAGCPMAEMYDLAEIRRLKEEVEDLAVVCYVNSTLELKGQSDVCVTSANAVKVVRGMPQRNIYFVPDENLGGFVAQQVPEKQFILHNGSCCVHTGIRTADLEQARRDYPNAEVLSHPECRPEILALSDYIGSTSGILKRAGESAASELIICTEMGILDELKRSCPDKTFVFPGERVCASMKKVTLEKIREVLRGGSNEIRITDGNTEQAAATLERMLLLAN